MARPQVNARPLWRISIIATQEAEEAVAFLMERVFGQSPCISTVAEADAITTTIYDCNPLSRTRRKELQEGLRQIEACGLNVRPCTILTRKVRREDWSESWKKHFRAIEIGSTLLIKPGWSKQRARKGQVVVVLDPGLSFGTGHHATTAFCLEQLVQARGAREQQSFLDIGTGSGILALAASKLRYSPVRAFDFDPVAVRVAKANARRNRVQQRVLITRQDLTKLPKESKTKYNLICANLTDDLLITQSDKIVHRLKSSGRLVLAGVLTTQFAAVRVTYENLGLRPITCRNEGEWQSSVFARSTAGSRARKIP